MRLEAVKDVFETLLVPAEGLCQGAEVLQCAEAPDVLPGPVGQPAVCWVVQVFCRHPSGQQVAPLRLTHTNAHNNVSGKESENSLKRGLLILTMLILFSFIMMRVHSRKANMSLCFSNRLRHTLLYRLKVKYSLMFSILCSTVSGRR